MVSNLSKILEKIIKNRHILFLEKHKLLSKHQFGFRPGLRAGDTLYSTTNCITNGLDKSMKIIAIFLDLAQSV